MSKARDSIAPRIPLDGFAISGRVFLISIEGNIGSGKSTFLRMLTSAEKRPNVIFLPEPVHIWESIRDPATGESILSKFYANQERYAFSFQIMAYISRLAEIRRAIRVALADPELAGQPIVIIMERCLLTDRHVFAKMLHEQGAIEPINYEIYLKWFDEFACELPITSVFYVRTSPEICHDRVARRSRDGEGGIPLDYLRACHNKHEEWLLTPSDSALQHKPTLYILDGDSSRAETSEDYKDWITCITDTINFISKS